MAWRIGRRLAPDRRALFELVSILRETEGALTESKRWLLQYICRVMRLKIRIARGSVKTIRAVRAGALPQDDPKSTIQRSRFDIGEQQAPGIFNRIVHISGEVLRPASEAIKRMTGL
jgi:hypothetical protein